MREALGLYGRNERPASRQQSDQQRPGGDRSSSDRSTSNGHRHRFVQDGEVPVVLAKHTSQGGTPSGVARGGNVPSPTNRVAALTAELSAEHMARERAERALQQALASVRDLQTKLAHAELARTEALDAARSEQETLAALQAVNREHEERATAELAAEREARVAAETTLQSALAALEFAELRGIQAVSEATPKRTAKAAAQRTDTVRKSATPRSLREPKPVKWWIRSDPTVKR